MIKNLGKISSFTSNSKKYTNSSKSSLKVTNRDFSQKLKKQGLTKILPFISLRREIGAEPF